MLGACLFKNLKRPDKRLNLPQPREASRHDSSPASGADPERVLERFSDLSEDGASAEGAYLIQTVLNDAAMCYLEREDRNSAVAR